MTAIRPLLEPPGTARDLIAAWQAAAALLAAVEDAIARRQTGAVLAICEREHPPCPFGFSAPGPECVCHIIRGECETVQRVEERWQRLGLATGGRATHFHLIPSEQEAEPQLLRATTVAETQHLLSALEDVCHQLRLELDC